MNVIIDVNVRARAREHILFKMLELIKEKMRIYKYMKTFFIFLVCVARCETRTKCAPDERKTCRCFL